MNKKNALIIFVKNPVLGKVKTRLAKTMGDDNALIIYQKLLEHTHTITKRVMADKYVFYSDYIDENDLWENEIYRKRKQIGHDLGEKMAHAFQSLSDQGYHRIVVIGSDAYELRSDDIHEAFDALENHDIVIGPAKDGGYYLLGLKEMIPGIFKDKSWSTERLLTETRTELKHAFKTIAMLRELSDVDHEEDLGDLTQFINLN